MKKKKERKYITREWRVMKSHLRAFIKKGGQEDLHSFRTGVKKLRALLILADSAAKTPGLEQRFKSIRKVFKRAGKIRDAYMNQELAKIQPGKNAGFIREQRHIMKTATSAFNADREQHLARLRKTRRKLTKRIGPISNLYISLYYERQLEAIAEILGRYQFDEELHACRKQLKILIYNYQLVRPKLVMPFNEAYLDQVQAAIGDWHDNRLAIAILSNAGTGNTAALNGLKKTAATLEKQLTELTENFQDRATTITELPVEQID